MKSYALAGSLLLAASAANADPAITTRNTDLLKDADLDSAKIESLNQNTKVDLSSKRKGKFGFVKTSAGKDGWVSTLALMPEGGAQSSSSSGNAFSSLLNSGRTSANSTGATAARGLGASDFDNAQPDEQQLQKMLKFSVSKEDGQSFAKRSKLTATASLEYMKDTSGAGSNNNNNGAPQTPNGL